MISDIPGHTVSRKQPVPWGLIMTCSAIVMSDLHLVKMVFDHCASLLLQCQYAHCLEHHRVDKRTQKAREPAADCKGQVVQK